MYLLIKNSPKALYYDEVVTLEGVEYLFEFLWSAREACWYMNLYDQDQHPIALLIRLVINWRLLRRFTDPRLPPGLLFCVDLTGNGQDIAASGDFGTRVVLVYITSDDPDFATSALP